MLILGLLVFLSVTLLMPILIFFLKRKGIMDDPHDTLRTHAATQDVPIEIKATTPRGGGIVMMPVIFLAWFMVSYYAFRWPNLETSLAVVFCGSGLCLATWLDDLREGGLTQKTRLLLQLVAVAVPLIMWPLDQGRLLPELLNPVVERVIMALAWLWFCNLYNFMDGINGISGTQAISIAGGLLVYCFIGPTNVPVGYPLLLVIIVAAAAGFLVWNCRPVAKIFLGDVGSIGLGYCLGFLLFVFAGEGHIVPAVLVALVYCMDATTTLLKLIWQRKKIWISRREHYYHRATIKGALTHLQGVGVIVLVNIILICLGLLLLRGFMPPIVGLLIGMALVAAMLVCFYYLGHYAGHTSTERGNMAPWQLRINHFMGRFFPK